MARIPAYVQDAYESGIFACNVYAIHGRGLMRDLRLTSPDAVDNAVRRMYEDLAARTQSAVHRAERRNEQAHQVAVSQVYGTTDSKFPLETLQRFGSAKVHPSELSSRDPQGFEYYAAKIVTDGVDDTERKSLRGGIHGGIVQQGI